MKKNFLSGLALLLPVVLTFLVIMFFINLLTRPFLGLVQSTFEYFGFLDKSFLFLSGQQIVTLTSKFLVLLTLFLLTLLIGFLAKHFFLDQLLMSLEGMIQRIPVVNKIYRAFQEAMIPIFYSKSTPFSQVVLVPYPHKKTYAIGFVTKEALFEGSDPEHLGLISVFVPGTPNPTVGFTLLYRKHHLVFLEMKVDDALKFVISCGVQFTEFKASP